jgi:hypothetical protein
MAGPGDGVLVVGTLSSLPYYYKGNPPLVNFDPLNGAGRPLSEQLRELSGDHERLWLVQIRPWQVDREGKVKAALDGTYGVVERQHFPGIDIYSYRVSK